MLKVAAFFVLIAFPKTALCKSERNAIEKRKPKICYLLNLAR